MTVSKIMIDTLVLDMRSIVLSLIDASYFAGKGREEDANRILKDIRDDLVRVENEYFGFIGSGLLKQYYHLSININNLFDFIEKIEAVAKFLWNCNQVDPVLAKQIATDTMDKLTETFRIRPTEYQGTGRLINALYAIDPALSASFVKNKKVRGRIQQSINEHDWSKEVEGLKHQIRALYRSAPELWKKMVNYKWLTVDLSALDLDSIYRDVDEERNAGTVYKHSIKGSLSLTQIFASQKLLLCSERYMKSQKLL